jgi:hypothetical protein
MLVGIPERPVEGVGSCPLGPPSAVHLHQGALVVSSDLFRFGDEAAPKPDALNRWVNGERGDPREHPGFGEAAALPGGVSWKTWPSTRRSPSR